MIRYEWKKLLFKRRGLALIAAFLAAQAILLLFIRPYDEVLERNREVYESYLTQVEGPLTAEKRAFLEAEMERMNSIHQELEQLKMDYYSGEVSEVKSTHRDERTVRSSSSIISFLRSEMSSLLTNISEIIR